jgi:uncharacterized protein (DUF342 family)
MPQYYLRHYFDPDMNYHALKPRVLSDHEADRYNLGYVQNVISGQVLAQTVPLDDLSDAPPVSLDPRFLLDEPILPQGPNTRVEPDYPQYLLADANGYVFYLNNLITVKKVLNVRSDVDFHTGNIFFVGDVAVHGDVRAGFEVQANRVMVKGMVEGGVVRARNDLALRGGARGGAGGRCLLSAGGNMRLAFAEKAELRAGGAVYIERTCQHAVIFAGESLLVKDRLQGGKIHVRRTAYVENQLGTSSGAPTAVSLGYSALRVRQMEKLDVALDDIETRVAHYTAVAGHLPPDSTPASRKLAMARQKLALLRQRRESIWDSLQKDERLAETCLLVVPGTVHPGVEISIGRAFLYVERTYKSVTFRLADGKIIIDPVIPTHSSR